MVEKKIIKIFFHSYATGKIFLLIKNKEEAIKKNETQVAEAAPIMP
jgi:uncharacterized membrane-anchored protein YitT (DUF2179 family)